MIAFSTEFWTNLPKCDPNLANLNNEPSSEEEREPHQPGDVRQDPHHLRDAAGGGALVPFQGADDGAHFDGGGDGGRQRLNPRKSSIYVLDIERVY